MQWETAPATVRFIDELEAGDAYLIPGGIVHHVVALEPAVLIEAFSPPRQDFLADLD